MLLRVGFGSALLVGGGRPGIFQKQLDVREISKTKRSEGEAYSIVPDTVFVSWSTLSELAPKPS